MSVPSDRLFVQIDVDLLGLEIFLDAPWPQFPAESGLFVTTPRRLDVSWLHVIYPNNSRAQSFYHAKRLEDIARPNNLVSSTLGGLRRQQVSLPSCPVPDTSALGRIDPCSPAGPSWSRARAVARDELFLLLRSSLPRISDRWTSPPGCGYLPSRLLPD